MNTVMTPSNPWAITRAAKSHLPGRRALWSVLDELASKLGRGTESFLAFRGTLASSCGISPRTLDRAKRELQELGFLSWEQTATTRRGPRRGPNLYQLHLGRIWEWVLEQREKRRVSSVAEAPSASRKPEPKVAPKIEPTTPRPEHRPIAAEGARSVGKDDEVAAGFAAALALLRGGTQPKPTVKAEPPPAPRQPPAEPTASAGEKALAPASRANPFAAFVDAVRRKTTERQALKESEVWRREERSRARLEQAELKAKYHPKPKAKRGQKE